MELLEKNKKYISIALVALIIYVRCVFGAVMGYAKIMNLVVDGLGILYCLYLSVHDFSKTKKSILNPAILWLVLFLGLEFVYGHFQLFMENEIYSMQLTTLTVLPALLVYEILWHQDDVLDQLSVVGFIVIIATFITNVKYDYLWGYALKGEFYRLGAVPGGSVIDTGNLYMLMLIPVLYSFIVKKQYKKYFLPALIGSVGILLTGSRSSAMPLAIIIAVLLLSTSKSKESLRKNIIILVVLAVLGTIALMTVPILYDTLGYRFVEIFDNLGATEYDLHSSTGQRMAIMAAFKEHFWEAPVFGHGFYAFKAMPYSQLEMYVEDGVTLFRNVQTHMNFLELLFSFGILGFVVYYWFPVKLVIDSFRTSHLQTKLITLSFLISIFFMDMGLDMFYKYMTPYYSYLLVYLLIQKANNQKEA